MTQLCEDEGCQFYGTGATCEPKLGGCVATVAATQPATAPEYKTFLMELRSDVVITLQDGISLVVIDKRDMRISLTKPSEAPPVDPVVEANRALLLQRSQLGIRKYGGTLKDKNYSRRELLQHALEEALDLANYLQADLQREDSDGKATP